MPQKAFLNGDEIANEYYVAHQLRMTVAELQEMSNLEFMRWTRYFAVLNQTRELEAKAAASRIGR